MLNVHCTSYNYVAIRNSTPFYPVSYPHDLGLCPVHARLLRPLCSSRAGARESGIGNWCRELRVGDRPPPCLKRPARARFVSSRVGVALINFLAATTSVDPESCCWDAVEDVARTKISIPFSSISLSVRYGTHGENLSAGGYVYASIICSAQQFRPYNRQGPRYDEAGLQNTPAHAR